jgi:Arc/MetJ-type ribon-helix-helix transcriptional regulator
MKRVTVGLTQSQYQKMDQLVVEGSYPNINEVVRTAVREHLLRLEEVTA